MDDRVSRSKSSEGMNVLPKESDTLKKSIKLRTSRLQAKLLKFSENFPSEAENDCNKSSASSVCSNSVVSLRVVDKIENNKNLNDMKTNLSKMTIESKNSTTENHSRNRTKSERSHHESDTLDTYRSQSWTNSDFSSQQKKKNGRGKRGEKKFISKQTIDKPFYEIDVKDLQLNAETFLLLDLLAKSSEDRDKYILELAKQRKILIQNSETDSYEINPKIKRLGFILQHGKCLYEINKEKIENMQRFIINTDSQCSSSRDLKQNINDKKKLTCFEDFVNAIVGENLTEKQRTEFLFDYTPKTERIENYYNTDEFNKKLEDFSQKCVEAQLGVIIEGEIRVNANNNDQAFIKNVFGQDDAMFTSQISRKCSLHGDIVRAFVRTISNSQEISVNTKQVDNVTCNKLGVEPDSDLDETLDNVGEEEIPARRCKAFVIKIITEIHNRICVGNFLSFRKNLDFVTFIPRDMKIPNIRVQKCNWPENLINGRVENFPDTLYVVSIQKWINEIPFGKVIQPIGKCGELESENKAILHQNNLNIYPYDTKFIEMYETPFTIPQEEYAHREDIRSDCIFTIDPLTARDLDDAMSCKLLTNGHFEIGVHISDVSYFLEEKSELDNIVKTRTTSVYMVNEVFHMLPKPLCFRCSLLPGEDKLAFSVFWEINSLGEIIETRFSRTVINSCTQLAYEHAQKIIDNPNKEFSENDFPQIHNGFAATDIVTKIKQMNKIAIILRNQRFDNGALKINRPKLYFDLNPETGEPTSYKVYELKSANFLIEEFMLLANQSVAKFIHEKFPKISILRNHLPPIKNVITSLKEQMQKLGLELDIRSSKTIYESMQKLINDSKNRDIMLVCLSHFISKPMTRARYFCSDGMNSEEFWHYALSIPIYTHFTSPIRRYPDVLVHRLLAAALSYTPPPSFIPNELNQIAKICNEQKYNAKLAGDDSINLYFLHFVQSKKSLVMKAGILNVLRYCFEAITIETGHKFRVSYNNDKKHIIIKVNETIPRTANLTFINSSEKCKSIELKTFSIIWLEVYVEKKKLKAKIVPAPPSTVSSSSE